MLPEDAVILFVHADRVFDRQRLAAAANHMGIEILNQPQAVAAQLQTVGARAHAVLADVEGVLAPLRRRRIAVGNDHLGQRGAIENGALLALIVVAQIVQRQSFTGIEADDEVPVLPANAVAVHTEARPFRLRDVERLDVLAEVLYPVSGIVALTWRQWPVAVFVETKE